MSHLAFVVLQKGAFSCWFKAQAALIRTAACAGSKPPGYCLLNTVAMKFRYLQPRLMVDVALRIRCRSQANRSILLVALHFMY